MSTIRQDAWSGDDDLILAEVVLRHIREGSTQLAAFEEVGKKLSRTSAACGFRWNSTIRKKYEAAIALARKQRHGSVKQMPQQEKEEKIKKEKEEKEFVLLENKQDKNVIDGLTMEDVIAFLREYEKEGTDPHSLKQLKKENALLKEELRNEREKNEIIAKDYKILVGIMERARNLSLYDEPKSEC